MQPISIKSVISILKKNGYKVKFTSYHIKKHISKFKEMKDVYANDYFFTIYDENGRVIGRCHSITKEDSEMNTSSIEKIKSYFEMYDIKNREAIVDDLEGIIKNLDNDS